MRQQDGSGIQLGSRSLHRDVRVTDRRWACRAGWANWEGAKSARCGAPNEAPKRLEFRLHRSPRCGFQAAILFLLASQTRKNFHQITTRLCPGNSPAVQRTRLACPPAFWSTCSATAEWADGVGVDLDTPSRHDTHRDCCQPEADDSSSRARFGWVAPRAADRHVRLLPNCDSGLI